MNRIWSKWQVKRRLSSSCLLLLEAFKWSPRWFFDAPVIGLRLRCGTSGAVVLGFLSISDSFAAALSFKTEGIPKEKCRFLVNFSKIFHLPEYCWLCDEPASVEIWNLKFKAAQTLFFSFAVNCLSFKQSFKSLVRRRVLASVSRVEVLVRRRPRYWTFRHLLWWSCRW